MSAILVIVCIVCGTVSVSALYGAYRLIVADKPGWGWFVFIAFVAITSASLNDGPIKVKYQESKPAEKEQ